MYKFSWALQNLSSTAALFITIVFWAVLYHYVADRYDTTGLIFSITLHGLNTVTCVLDIFINARPVQISHFYFASFFGVYYGLFSIIYWMLGGTGGLACNITELGSEHEESYCEHFIYNITDWEDHPLQGLALLGAGIFLIIPVLQACWWLLYKLRIALKSCCCKGQNRREQGPSLQRI